MSVEKKRVGKVTPEQRDEIQALFERRNSLKELFPIVPPENKELYERVVADMGETARTFEQWWKDRAEEYGWEGVDGGNWEINFETCEIYLNAAQCCGNCGADGK